MFTHENEDGETERVDCFHPAFLTLLKDLLGETIYMVSFNENSVLIKKGKLTKFTKEVDQYGEQWYLTIDNSLVNADGPGYALFNNPVELGKWVGVYLNPSRPF